MLQTLFPMATGTHRLNNGLLVEEQEESSHSKRLGDFQQAHTLLQNVCECVFAHSEINTRAKALSTQTRTQIHKQVQICGYPLPVIATMVIVFGCLHTLVSLISK